MRINPLNIVLDGKTQLDKNFYFITGNEITFIEKIKDKILENYRKDKGNKIERLKDLTQITNDVGLFEKRNIYLTSSINDIDNDLLDKSHVRGDILLIYVENSPKSKLLKNIFIKRKDSYSIECYELSREDKVRVLSTKLNMSNIKLDDGLFWFLIETLDNRFVFFEKEIDKILSLKVNDVDIVNKLISLNAPNVDGMFFEIFNKNEKLINLYNTKIQNDIDLNSFYFSFKQYCLLIINNDKEDDYINNIPRYLFREKNYLIKIYRMFDNKKKNLLLNLIFETEKLIRKNKDLSVLIGLRFLLSFKKLVIS